VRVSRPGVLRPLLRDLILASLPVTRLRGRGRPRSLSAAPGLATCNPGTAFQELFSLCALAGVGKSSLVHLLCHNQVLGNPSWTVGCSVDVRIHDYREGTPEEKTYYIELWDVGGSVGSATSVKSTRAVFYNLLNGIILVHDLTNKKSSQNLYRWSLEALNRDVAPTGVLVTNGDYDREQFGDNQIPLLVIGTKLDQIPETKRNEVLTRTAFLAEDFNAEEINLDCTNPRYLAAGSSNAVKLSRFFDKIPGFSERKRFGGGTLKSLHYD
uniref:Rab-like protein 3 n=1 Tax=Taeniopygia guttata TaxID=59729 RepID=H0ZT22_TAEGU